MEERVDGWWMFACSHGKLDESFWQRKRLWERLVQGSIQCSYGVRVMGLMWEACEYMAGIGIGLLGDG